MVQPVSSSTQQPDRDRRPDQAFGIVLRRYRIHKQLTQEQVAWNTGMSRVYISEIERGLREPGLGTILKLAKCLQIPASDIVAAVEQELGKAV